MLKLYITSSNGETDCSVYTDWGTVTIQSQLGVPSQLSMTMYQFDQRFIPPYERCRVRIYSETLQDDIFTGYVAVSPDQTFIALADIGQYFSYAVKCTSDEYLLNFKAPPYIPAFINQTQGQILAQLAEILMPGFFDTSLIEPGALVPYFAYDPTKTWSAYAKEFCDSSRYFYYVRGKKIMFAPYGAASLGITYDENNPSREWNSQKLATTVMQVPTVNDVTVIGDVEAGSSRDDYFIGDGFTAEFDLKYATYQSRTALLLQDDFTAQALNTQNWTLNDPQNNFDFSASALNVVSALTGPTLTGQLIANNSVELAGGIELQHGEFQWNDQSQGEVGGLYFDGSITESLCSFNISSTGTITTSASGAAGILMTPTLSGLAVGAGIISQINHHYVLRTRISAPAETRFQQTYATRDGVYFGGQQSAVLGDITWEIEDVDIGATYNQALTGLYNFPVSTTFSFAVSGVMFPAYAAYALINNANIPLPALAGDYYLLPTVIKVGKLFVQVTNNDMFVKNTLSPGDRVDTGFIGIRDNEGNCCTLVVDADNTDVDVQPIAYNPALPTVYRVADPATKGIYRITAVENVLYFVRET